MKIFAKIYTVIFTVCLFFILGFIAIIIPSTSTAFYSSQFDKYNSVEMVQREARDGFITSEPARNYVKNIDKNKLISLMHHAMRYCLYLEPDLNPTIDGERLEIFREQDYVSSYSAEDTNGNIENEYKHMADVKRVFGGGMLIILFSVAVVVAGVILFIRHKNFWYEHCRFIPFITLGALVVILGVLGVIVLADFDNAFRLFHVILFNNENWIFSRGVMVYMISYIFEDIAPLIVGIWVGLLALAVGGFIFTNARLKRKVVIKLKK